jgi:hypothetical protein
MGEATLVELVFYWALTAVLLSVITVSAVAVVLKAGWRGLVPPPPATYLILRHLLRSIIGRRG